MIFQLDTSGYVADTGGRAYIMWRHLSPFMQGYIEALFADLDDEIGAELGVLGRKVPAFSDLAPETLARIIADCERFAKMHPTAAATVGGKGFWTERQADGFPRFPPLTVQLGDDGKVVFSERG